MDAFETVVASVLQRQGFWTMTSVKVELSKPEKRSIGRKSSPRWELDVVAYRGRTNELRVVECKSFLNSKGVGKEAFDGTRPDVEKRYKLFHEPKLRRVVVGRLVKQLVGAGFCTSRVKVSLCLAAGKTYGDETWLRRLFKRKGWLFLGPVELRQGLVALKDSGYENSVSSVVVKLLLKGRDAPS